MPDERPGELQAVPPLQSLYIYATNECNQRCPHCWIDPIAVGRSRVETPSPDNYFRVIDAALPLGLTYVKLTGGEPLLRPEAFPVLAFAAKRGVVVGLETNGMLLGEKEAEFLKEHSVQVSISLDGASPEVHDRRRGLSGAFESTLKGLKFLIAAGIPTTVTAAISRSNYEEIERILELLRGIKGSVRVDLKINPIVPVGRASRMGKRQETLGPDELLKLAEKVGSELIPQYRRSGIGIVLQLELAFFSIDSIVRRLGTTGAGHCGFLSLLSVLADGSITFCGIGYSTPHLTMGNIREHYDLPWLWRNHRLLVETRRTVRHGLDGICRQCLFHPVCLGGCRAAALAVRGSIAASPPSCQALYEAGLFPLSRLKDEALASYAEIAPKLRASYEEGSRRHADVPGSLAAVPGYYSSKDAGLQRVVGG